MDKKTESRVKQLIDSGVVELVLENFIEYAFIFEQGYLNKRMMKNKAKEFSYDCKKVIENKQ